MGTTEDAVTLLLLQQASTTVAHGHWDEASAADLIAAFSSWLARDDLRISMQDQMRVMRITKSVARRLGLDACDMVAEPEQSTVRPGPLMAAEGAQPCANHLWVVPACKHCQARPQPRHCLLVKDWMFKV